MAGKQIAGRSKYPIRETLQECWTEILKDLNLSKLILGQCYSYQLITYDDKQRINKKETNSDMNEVLLDHAHECWNADYLWKFCGILQEHLAVNPEGHATIREKICSTYELKAGISLEKAALGHQPQESKAAAILSASTLDSKPTLPLLLDSVPIMSSEWRILGMRLGIESYILDNIDKDERGKVVDCCMRMFKEWLGQKNGTGDRTRTWKTVLECVERVYDPARRVAVETKLQKTNSEGTRRRI